MRRGRKQWSAVVSGLFAVALFAAPGEAGAEDKVDVRAEVVLASNAGDKIDPPNLSEMKSEFARSGISFSSWVRQSDQRVSLTKGQKQDVSLPDGRKATLGLEQIKDGSAFVRVSIPQDKQRKLVDTVYQLGRQGSVFIRAGDHAGGVLILVLSPPEKRAGRTPQLPEGAVRRLPLPRAELSSAPLSP